MNCVKLVTALAAGLIASSSAFAGAIVPLLNNEYELPKCLQCESGPADIGFNINFDGSNLSVVYVSTRGGIYFSDNYSPSVHGNVKAVILPFSSPYIDTRKVGTITYGNISYDGHLAFVANWIDVGYVDVGCYGTGQGCDWDRTFSFSDAPYTNSFQLILVDRSDTGEGNFDFILNYDSIQWGSGDTHWPYNAPYYDPGYIPSGYIAYSGGTIGNTWDGVTASPQAFALSQLPYYRLNSDVAGRYVFEVRGGVVTTDITLIVPEPETWAMLLVGLGIVGAVTRKQRATA